MAVRHPVTADRVRGPLAAMAELPQNDRLAVHTEVIGRIADAT